MTGFRSTTLLTVGVLTVGCAASRENKSSQPVEAGECGLLAVWDVREGAETLAADPDSAWIEMQETVTLTRINLIVAAAGKFCEIYGRYPADLAELSAASSDGTLPTRCSTMPEFLSDWWGKPFDYISEPELEVTSAGPDGAFGSSDDLRSTRIGVDQAAVQLDLVAVCGS